MNHQTTQHMDSLSKSTPHFSPIMLVMLASIMALTPFAVDMYLPAFSIIGAELNASAGQMQQSISIFLVVFGFGQLVFGPVTDHFGRKPIIVLGLILFVISSYFAAFSDNITQLMIARFWQAISGAGCSVAVLATLRDHFHGNQLAKMNSYLTMVIVIVPILAPSIGVVILSLASWPWIFLSLFFIGTSNLIIYYCSMRESLSSQHKQPLNFKQAIHNYLFIIKNPISISYLGITSFSSASMFVFITSSSFVYIDYFAVSKTAFGLLFAANVLLMMLMSFVNARLLNHFAWQTLLKWGMLMRLPAAILLMLVAWLDLQPLLPLLVLSVILNIGLSPMVSANAQAGLLNQYAKMAGSASALAGGVRFLVGGLAGFTVSVFDMQNHLVMCWAMTICTVCMFLSFILLRHAQKTDST